VPELLKARRVVESHAVENAALGYGTCLFSLEIIMARRISQGEFTLLYGLWDPAGAME
jgi:hypothetical protein